MLAQDQDVFLLSLNIEMRLRSINIKTRPRLSTETRLLSFLCPTCFFLFERNTTLFFKGRWSRGHDIVNTCVLPKMFVIDLWRQTGVWSLMLMTRNMLSQLLQGKFGWSFEVALCEYFVTFCNICPSNNSHSFRTTVHWLTRKGLAQGQKLKKFHKFQ